MNFEQPDMEEMIDVRLTKNQALILATAAAEFGNHMGIWKSDISPGELAGLTAAMARLGDAVIENPTVKVEQEATKALCAAICTILDWTGPKIHLQ